MAARLFFGACCMLAALAVTGGDAPEYTPLQCDPAMVVGHENCAKCHDAELKQWMQTPHYRTFDTLHRTPEAKAIADQLGLRSVKRNDTCVTCHYTRQQQGARLRVVAGVGCESCHGGAKDWLGLHADYGGPSVTRELESLGHRESRIEASIAAGMNNPANLYLIARQCLSCHTVPDERLVNLGGHKAGTADFELVAWSQGKVRHNFVRSGGTVNATSDIGRLRVMYVVGVMADLEASLRATAKATELASYGQQSAARAARRKQQLWQVQRLIDDPVVARALDAVATVKLTLGNEAAITAAAEAVGKAAFEFAQTDGARLAALDPLLPTPAQYKK